MSKIRYNPYHFHFDPALYNSTDKCYTNFILTNGVSSQQFNLYINCTYFDVFPQFSQVLISINPSSFLFDFTHFIVIFVSFPSPRVIKNYSEHLSTVPVITSIPYFVPNAFYSHFLPTYSPHNLGTEPRCCFVQQHPISAPELTRVSLVTLFCV